MRVFLTYLAVFFCLGAMAQQKTLIGTVASKETGAPINGVTVKSAEQTVTTDKDGKFSIAVNNNGLVTFSFVGLQSFTYTFKGGNTPVAITLANAASNLNE